jgi:hypothetical protein
MDFHDREVMAVQTAARFASGRQIANASTPGVKVAIAMQFQF